MGVRGPAPLPTAIRVLEGNRSRRPLPANEPRYKIRPPKRPADLSPAARKIWNQLVAQMTPVGVLRSVDGLALAQLCEDQALLDTLRQGLLKMATQYREKAAKEGKVLPGNEMIAIARTTEGRRALSSIRELAAHLIVQRREFGLTPASNSRLETLPFGELHLDPVEGALCG